MPWHIILKDSFLDKMEIAVTMFSAPGVIILVKLFPNFIALCIFCNLVVLAYSFIEVGRKIFRVDRDVHKNKNWER